MENELNSISLGTDIIEYSRMRKNEQKREHFRVLIDAGMVQNIENIKVNVALRGKPIIDIDPMLKEVVNDYIKYRNRIKEEEKAKKKAKDQTPEGEVKA